MTPPAAAPASVPLEKTEAIRQVQASIARVIRGKDDRLDLVILAVLAGGHVLIEDIPGVGKTTLARSLAASLGGSFRRVQFTSDLLPSDIIGVSVYHPQSETFEFRRGPLFANVVLADEINRTTPRTQSALLEAMSEGKVSVDDQTYDLGEPFMVLATQNPAEHFGTYPLPESQMDRFLLRIRLGYPSRIHERDIVKKRGHADPVEELSPVIDAATLSTLQDAVETITVDDQLLDYAMTIVEETRASPLLSVGVSTRGALAWYRSAQALALLEGRDFCIPDDFKGLAISALAHRVVLSVAQDSLGRARDEAERASDDILGRVPVPA